jgi:hypothetical protein
MMSTQVTTADTEMITAAAAVRAAAEAAAAEARARWAEAVVHATRGGVPLAAVGRVANISAQRVHQLAQNLA